MMRFNEREVTDALLLSGCPDLEGRLNYRKESTGAYTQAGFKERWFKLKSNVLFYFRINEVGNIEDKQPLGLLVLEHCTIYPEVCSTLPFAFSISYRDEPDKKYMFGAWSEENVKEWVTKLKKASYEYWRSQLTMLQSTISKRTGKDPLLLYPRNRGYVRDFQENGNKNQIGAQSSSFQSHILPLSSANPPSLSSSSFPLSRSSSSSVVTPRPILPPPRGNILSRSASSTQACNPIPPPPRTSKSQSNKSVLPVAQVPTLNSNVSSIDNSPNLIEL